MQNDNSLILNFVVNNQTIVRNDNNIIIENSQNYLKARFEFSSEWEECTKIAKFEYNNKCYSSKFINENECYIPSEVIKSPYFNIALVGYGTNNIVKITTGYYLVEVGETCVHSGQYANVTNIVSNTLDIKKSGNVVSIETKGNQPQEPSEPQEPIDVNLLKEVTYDELVALRNNNELVAGQMYRIIDYVTTSMQKYTSSAYHQFDIIVTALSTNKLSENARAIPHKGDTYFEEVIEHIEVSGDPYLPSDFTIDKLEVAYTMYVDFNEQYDNQEIEGLARNDIFVEYSYKENNEGKLVPILYKTNKELLEDEGTDYQDTYYFVDKYTYNGVTYDRWRKIEDNVTWDDEGKIYALTNQVVEFQNASETITYEIKQYANLMAWEIKYCLDNDTERFAWASNHNVDMLHTDDDIWLEYGGEIEVNGVKYHKWVSKDFDEDDACLLIDSYDFINIEAQNFGSENYSSFDEYSLHKYNENSGNFEEGYSSVTLDENEGSPYKDLYYIPKGKGVIYYMKDEYNNECPYDFKNILFKRWGVNSLKYKPEELFGNKQMFAQYKGRYIAHTWFEELIDNNFTIVQKGYRLVYTFSHTTRKDLYTVEDMFKVCTNNKNRVNFYNNVISSYNKDNILTLNDIIFIVENADNPSIDDMEEMLFVCRNNKFDNDCFSNTIYLLYNHNEDRNSRFYENFFGKNTIYNYFGNLHNSYINQSIQSYFIDTDTFQSYINVEGSIQEFIICDSHDILVNGRGSFTCIINGGRFITMGCDNSNVKISESAIINIGSYCDRIEIGSKRREINIGDRGDNIYIKGTTSDGTQINIGQDCNYINISSNTTNCDIDDYCGHLEIGGDHHKIGAKSKYININSACTNINIGKKCGGKDYQIVIDTCEDVIIGDYCQKLNLTNCNFTTIKDYCTRSSISGNGINIDSRCELLSINGNTQNNIYSNIKIGKQCSDIIIPNNFNIVIGDFCNDINFTENTDNITIGDCCNSLTIAGQVLTIGNHCYNISTNALNSTIGNKCSTITLNDVLNSTIGNNCIEIELNYCEGVNVETSCENIVITNCDDLNIGSRCEVIDITKHYNSSIGNNCSRLSILPNQTNYSGKTIHNLNIKDNTRQGLNASGRLVIDPYPLLNNLSLSNIAYYVEYTSDNKIVASYQETYNTKKGVYKAITDSNWTEF